MLYITSNPKTYVVFFCILIFTNLPHHSILISNKFQLHFGRGNHGSSDTLEDLGISEDKRSAVNFYLSTCDDQPPNNITLFSNDVALSVKQTTKGQSVFLSSLYSVVSHIKEYTFIFKQMLMFNDVGISNF